MHRIVTFAAQRYGEAWRHVGIEKEAHFRYAGMTSSRTSHAA